MPRGAKFGHKVSLNTRKKLRIANLGNKNPSYGKKSNWKGGIRKHTSGYLWEYCPTHPHCSKQKYVFQHRLVMEKHIGRILLPTEVVHHINGIRDDNNINNLMLFISNSKHMNFHKIQRNNRK